MKISIETIVNADIGTVWATWNSPRDMNSWNSASDDWHARDSTVDLRVGCTFSSRMEAKDGSMGFDFEGINTTIVEKERIEYVMDDGRCVSVVFATADGGVKVTETFDADIENDPELQRQGWQSILNNFARHVESKVS